MKIGTLKELVDIAEGEKIPVSRVVVRLEADEQGISEEAVREEMGRRVAIMRDALREGTTTPLTSKSGLIKGGAYLMAKAQEGGKTIIGGAFSKVVANALAAGEVNACMGRIVAAPTAGSCGVLPGTLIVVAEYMGIDEETLVNSFFTAGGIGMAIERQATLAGAKGGCQAECGAASAMAAGALVELVDPYDSSTPRRVANAAAFALKSTLGLICDPVAGLVEVPCVKRNVMGAVNALAAAEMALAGIDTVIPVDEVITAMGEVGKKLPPEFRETGHGGVAATPTARSISTGL